MRSKVILDAGPWVAYLLRDDAYHNWAVEQFGQFDEFVTCEPVVAEVCARLAYHQVDPGKALEFLEDGSVVLAYGLGKEVGQVIRLMAKYRDQGMDLADACVVRMTEIQRWSQVMTVDRDFRVYRRFGRETIETIHPDWSE